MKAIKCKLCKSDNVNITYHGMIRDGALGRYTKMPVSMYRCTGCGVIWHNPVLEDQKRYYESAEYRESMDEGVGEDEFYAHHDRETLDKLRYTGTDIFRHKIVADIGSGAGAFLDFIKGVGDTVIGVEPTEEYRRIMERKGMVTYAYMEDIIAEFASMDNTPLFNQREGGGIDVVTSFDVIEHVQEPAGFMKNIHAILKKGGRAIIGTPTEAPVMRELLGEIYERKQLFSTQHPWVFSQTSLNNLSIGAGFEPDKIKFKFFQRYGVENMLGWLRDKKPRAELNMPFAADALDAVLRAETGSKGMADYIVVYLEK